MSVRVIVHLCQALRTMRDACDDAERRVSSGDSDAIQRVLHALAWGSANASSSIENALAVLEDERAIEAARRAT